MRVVIPLAVVMGTALVGQRPPTDAAAIAKGLASDRAVDVAWAAHHARESEDGKLGKPLQQALARWLARDDAEAPVVRLHVLDALVGLAPRMPATDVLPLLDDPVCGVAAFALVAREPAHNEAALLALFRRDWAAWDPAVAGPMPRRLLAVGDLLAARRSPGLAAAIAPRVEFDVDLLVLDQGAPHVGQWSFGIAPSQQPAPDWPPYPNYRFLDPARLGGDAWQAVPMPAPLDQAILRKAAVERRESGTMSFSIGRDDWPTAKANWPGVDWLCVMAGSSRRQRGTTITWSTQQAFVAAAVAARTERQQFVDALRERLVGNGCLAAADAKLLDRRVAVRASDQRADQTTPLPPIPPAR